MRLFSTLTMATLVLTLFALGPAAAQVPLAPLWPNDDGMRWDYEMEIVDIMAGIDMTLDAFLALEGNTMTPGGEAQNLIAVQTSTPPALAADQPELPALLLTIWRARPDLRAAIEAGYGGKDVVEPWYPLFLHGGYFLKSPDDIQMWQEFSHPTWTYLEAPVMNGQSFVQQLVPEFADDIFLYGTVADTEAEVSTPFGTFSGAVKMEYLVDLGVSSMTDEQGNLIATVHGENVGHVYFVPGVGPVDLLEEYTPFVWADCPDGCPPEIADYIGVVVTTVTMRLSSSPVAEQQDSWGMVKSLYRQ